MRLLALPTKESCRQACQDTFNIVQPYCCLNPLTENEIFHQCEAVFPKLNGKCSELQMSNSKEAVDLYTRICVTAVDALEIIAWTYQ